MILYIRHGQTDYNVKDLWMGSVDVPLNEHGRTQAENAAMKLSSIIIDKIYSSSLGRAYETASIIASRQSIPPEIVVLPGLRERCFGELEGTFKGGRSSKDLCGLLGVEGKEEFRNRVESSMSVIKKNENSLVVSHSAVFQCLIGSLGYSATPNVIKIMNCQVVSLAL